MPKPFSLQSPEAIAKEYGGNKQRIAQAMQSGIIDPTAGTLAGMFIDRMRSAQSQEMQPQPTIAQQVFAPPAAMPPGALPPPPGGMGGPQMSAPPMGAPPAPTAEPPTDQTLMMADGGLAGLPIPDTMFDEPSNGGFDDGYAHGGIVAFAEAGPVLGYSANPMDLVEEYRRLYKPRTEASERARKLYEGDLSEEGRKTRASEDKWFALAQLGATMASTPGSLLQAAGAGINKALPGLQESAKERRAEQRDAIKQLALNEGASNEEARREADLYMQGKGKYAELKAAQDVRAAEEKLQRDKMAQDRELGLGQIAATRAAAATRQKPDPVMIYAQSIYENKKQLNDRLPSAKSYEEYKANPNAYRKADAYIRSESMKEAMGARYFAPFTEDKQANAAAMRAAIGQPDGAGGPPRVNLGGWNDNE